MVKNFFLFFVLLCCSTLSFGQNNQKMMVWQDSLVNLGPKKFGRLAEAERIESNFKFVKTLVSSLKESNSFYFKFDKLQMISVLDAPDGAFRIFSWNVPLDDGSYLYYGSIQFKSGTLKLVPLLDKTFQIKDANKAIVLAKDWYGAQYYDIITLQKGKYVLLGWKGHHADYTKKVIDVLNISSSGEVSFGGAIFSDDNAMVRKIFSYTKQASMYLKYNKNNSQIEFDHIVPADSSLKGNYKYYGPDLSYDAYKIKNGKLEFTEDVEVLMIERGDENQYLDPKKPNKSLKSGL